MKINLYTFIKEEGQCKWLGCKHNDLGICECMDSLWQHDIRMKSSDLLNSDNPQNIEYECFMAKAKLNHCMCGKEIDKWSVDGFEHAFGTHKYKNCKCDCV